MKIKDIEELQDTLKNAEKKLQRQEGRKDALLQRIKEEFGYDTIEELRDEKLHLDSKKKEHMLKLQKKKEELQIFVDENNV